MVKRSVHASALRLVTAVVVAVAAGSGPVFAQTRPSNAFFLETRPDPARGQRLDVTVSSAGGFDKDTSLEDCGLGGIGLQGPAGESVLVTANVDYALLGRRTQFRATAATTTRYYGSLDDLLHSANDDASHAAAAGFMFHTPATSLVVNQTANYSSSLLYTFLPTAGAIAPGAGPPATADYGLSDSQIYVYTSAAEFTQRLTARNSVSAAAGWEYSDVVGGQADNHSLNVYRARAGLAHHAGPNLTLMGGYVFRTGDVAAGRLVPYGQSLNEHGAELGLDYRRPLSATRGFMTQVRVGGSTISLPAVIDVTGNSSRGRRYEQFSGQLTTAYDFGRSWQAAGTVRRGLEDVSGLGEPVLADSVTARLDGLLARRVDFRLGRVFERRVGVESARIVVQHLHGDVRLRYALTRTLAASVEYLYYFYDSRRDRGAGPGTAAEVRTQRRSCRLDAAAARGAEGDSCCQVRGFHWKRSSRIVVRRGWLVVLPFAIGLAVGSRDLAQRTEPVPVARR